MLSFRSPQRIFDTGTMEQRVDDETPELRRVFGIGEFLAAKPDAPASANIEVGADEI
jgi:hypothetical protein